MGHFREAMQAELRLQGYSERTCEAYTYCVLSERGTRVSAILAQRAARSRNARLAAIHAFFRYVAFMEPAHALLCQRVLAIPSKRFERGVVEFLGEKEVDALLDAPDPATWIGRRRVSELTALRRQDVTLGTGAHVRCHGKGRKLRCTPLRRDVTRVLEAWLRECPQEPDKPVFPSSRGGPMSGDAVERLVAKHVAAARQRCPSLGGKRVTPHTLRHTAAMQLLRRGDLATFAWSSGVPASEAKTHGTSSCKRPAGWRRHREPAVGAVAVLALVPAARPRALREPRWRPETLRPPHAAGARRAPATTRNAPIHSPVTGCYLSPASVVSENAGDHQRASLLGLCMLRFAR